MTVFAIVGVRTFHSSIAHPSTFKFARKTSKLGCSRHRSAKWGTCRLKDTHVSSPPLPKCRMFHIDHRPHPHGHSHHRRWHHRHINRVLLDSATVVDRPFIDSSHRIFSRAVRFRVGIRSWIPRPRLVLPFSSFSRRSKLRPSQASC